MKGSRFIYGFCVVFVLLATSSYACKSANSSTNACPQELQQCVELLKHRDLCSNLQNICAAIASGNASHYTHPSFSNNQCLNGEQFCPTTQSCQPQNSTCDLNTVNTACSGSVSAPWGQNCSLPNHHFCPITMSCIHTNRSCSMRDLYAWSLAGITNRGPYNGTQCSSGQTFCLATMSCINENATCEVHVNVSMFASYCPGNASVFCPKRGGCIPVNASCSQFQALNLVNTSDPGHGWKQVCEARQSVCTRYTVGLARCFPLISNCSSVKSIPVCNVNQTYCNFTSKCQMITEPCCPGNHTFCNFTKTCQIPEEPCCPGNHTFCNFTKTCQIPEQPCCPGNHTFCNFTKTCQIPEEPCCPGNHTFCNGTGKCHRPEEPCCSSSQILCNFTKTCQKPGQPCCPGNHTFCNGTGKCHRPEEPCCSSSQILCNFTKTCQKPGQPCCPVNHTFCNGTGKCHRPEEPCCSSSQILCNFTKTCQKPGQPCCPGNHTFCNGTGKCHRPEEPCCSSSQILCNFTKTCQKPGQPCCPGNHTFCNGTGKCHRPEEPCCSSSQILCNFTKTCQKPGQPCCPGNHTFCNGTGKCHRPEEPCCSSSQILCNFTKTCQKPGQPCCPGNHTFCNGTGKCHRPGEPCCSASQILCNFTKTCQKPGQPCCPGNHTFCNGTGKCHRPGEPCCSASQIFCNFTKKCQIPEEPCCPGNHTFCNFTKTCQKPGQPCCPGNHTFCNGTGKCHRPDEPCCSASQILCNLTNTCLKPGQPCCPVSHTFCNGTGKCHRPEVPCCSASQILCNLTNTCLKPGQPCCPVSHTFCNGTGKCHRPEVPCCSASQILCNLTNTCLKPGQPCCPVSHTFCNVTNICHRPKEPCCPGNHTFCNTTGKCHQIGLPCCLENEIFCNETTKCHRLDQPCCPPDQSFCNTTKQCHQPSELCCLPGQTLCKEREKCHFSYEPCCKLNHTYCNSTSKCQPDDNVCCREDQPECLDENFYKTAWEFQELKETSISMFASGESIAVTSVSTSNGTFEYHDGAKWVSVSGISPSTALVLGKTNMVRFVHSDPMFHGVVLVNYTKKAGVVGQKVDASSSPHGPFDVIALVTLVDCWPPRQVLSEHGPSCEMNEDDSSNPGLMISEKIKLSKQVFGNGSNIPLDVADVMKPSTVKVYNEWLNFAKNSKPAVAITPGPDVDASKGKLDFDSSPAIISDLSRRFKINPKLNYNGPFEVVFGNGIMYEVASNRPANTMLFPDKVGKILFTLLIDGDIQSDVNNKYMEIMKSVEDAKKPPSKDDVLAAAVNMENQASGADKALVTAAKDLLTKAFTLAEKVTGKQNAPLQLGTNVVNEDGKRYIFVKNTNEITVKCKVLPVNDAPELTSSITYFPPVEFNLTSSNGFTIGQITTRKPYPFGETPPSLSDIPALIKDSDNKVFGVGICCTKRDSLGAYYWRQNAQSSWTEVNLTNTVEKGKPVGENDILLLGPTAQLKFEPTNHSIFWTNTEAAESANLLLVAWDQSDNKTSGIHKFTFPVSGNASISSTLASAYSTRKGCDGKPGSRGQIDACGKCGGDGEWCKGCDGVAFSGAVIDHCGNCTGNSTGKKFNFLKDCGGGCGTSFKDNCDVCQQYGQVRNFTDCAGKCFGEAIENSCGHCVLGSTGKPETFGQDKCGVCGGSNSTCLDCAGTPKGTKSIDTCGNCLEPTDARYDAECVKLTNMDPISGDTQESNTVKVTGAGLQNYKTASCQFQTTYDMTDVVLAKKEISFKIPPSVPVGTYTLRCKFDSLETFYDSQNNFTLYSRTSIKVNSISPNESEADTAPVNVTITGTGFPNTGYIRCITDVDFNFPAILIDDTRVVCLVGKLKKSRKFKLYPQFGAADLYINPTAPQFGMYVWSPHPVSATFTQNLQSLLLVMNKPAKHDSESCVGLFTDTSKFGSDSACILNTPQSLYIDLIGKPTIAPGDSISFVEGKLSRMFEDYTKPKTGTKPLTVQKPPKDVVPVAVLAGPNKVGACGEVVLDASASYGAGGRELAFNWTASWTSGQVLGDLTANATKDISDIQTMLGKLKDFSPRVKFTKENIALGSKYQFGVKVTNFLGTASTISTLVVVRENKELPVIDAGQARRKVKASRDVRIQVTPILSPCLNPNDVASNVLFTWEIDAVGVDLGIADKPMLIIKAGSLQGGKEYTLTVRASMASDQNLYSTKNIVLEVERSALIAAVDGGSYQVVGATGTLKLDASTSRDPDGSSEAQWYNWKCQDSSNPCFVPDSDNAGKQKRLVMPSTAVVTLDVAKTLKSNKEYTFTMTYNKGSRKASKKVVVKVEPGNPPKLIITQQVELKQNPTEPIIIKAYAESTMASTSVRWDSVEDDECGYIDLRKKGVALTDTSFTLVKDKDAAVVTSSFALVLAAKSLADGVCYKFRVNVSHSDSSAIGETIIVTNAAPSQGSLEVSPTNGTATETLFTVSAPNGWSDDPEDLPLQYQFGYFSADQEEVLNFFGEATILEEIKFPPGDPDKANSLKVFVDVMDGLGAVTRQTTTITVMPKEITEAFLEESQAEVLKSLDSGDWNKALGNIGAIMSTVNAGGKKDANKTKAITAMKEAFASRTLSILKIGGLTSDSGSKDFLYDQMSSITEGGTALSSNTKTEISGTVFTIETGKKSGSKRRRRRAAEVSSSVKPYTVTQAKSALSLQSNLIDPAVYDSTNMNLKSQFLAVVDSTGKKVCAGLAVGMAAATVQDKLLVLRSEKNSFANVGQTFIDMACNDCPGSLEKSAKVKLGTALQSKYASWDCSGGAKLCSGACLVTSQQTNDLLSKSDPAKLTLTSVVDMKLYNPSTYADIVVSGLASPVIYHLPVLNVTINKPFFECNRWDSSSWTRTGCVTTPTYVVENGTNVKYVECNCTTLGYTAAFQTDTPPPTPSPAPNTVPTTATLVKVRRVILALQADYNTLVTPGKLNQLIEDVTLTIAKTMNINESRITNMTFTEGSIIVKFVLLPSSSDSESSLTSTLALLESAVKGNKFTVTLSDGTVLKADPESFASSVGDVDPTLPTPTNIVPTEKDSSLTEGEIIAISCACAGVVLLIFIVILVYWWKKKHSSHCFKVSPAVSEASLQQQNMEMRHRSSGNPEIGQVNQAW